MRFFPSIAPGSDRDVYQRHRHRVATQLSLL